MSRGDVVAYALVAILVALGLLSIFKPDWVSR